VQLESIQQQQLESLQQQQQQQQQQFAAQQNLLQQNLLRLKEELKEVLAQRLLASQQNSRANSVAPTPRDGSQLSHHDAHGVLDEKLTAVKKQQELKKTMEHNAEFAGKLAESRRENERLQVGTLLLRVASTLCC